MIWTGERVVPLIMDKNRGVIKEHMARYIWAMNYCRDKSVIDAASGAGYGCAMISEITSRRVLGLDVSEEAIKYSEEKYPDIPFRLCNLETGYNIKSDVVTSFETIEHLDDPNEFLKSVKANCKLFIFSIPINLPGKYHKQVYSSKEIRKIAEKYFDNIQWFNQKGNLIKDLIINDAKFMLGVATIL